MKPDWINETNRVEPLKTGEVLVIETQAYPCTPRGFEAALADLEAIQKTKRGIYERQESKER